MYPLCSGRRLQNATSSLSLKHVNWMIKLLCSINQKTGQNTEKCCNRGSEKLQQTIHEVTFSMRYTCKIKSRFFLLTFYKPSHTHTHSYLYIYLDLIQTFHFKFTGRRLADSSCASRICSIMKLLMKPRSRSDRKTRLMLSKKFF